MDSNQTLLTALRKIAAKAHAAKREARASDLRDALENIAHEADRAVAPYEPTVLELRAALERIAASTTDPAVAQMARGVLR